MRTPVTLAVLTCLTALTAGCATSSAPDGAGGAPTSSGRPGADAVVRVDLLGYLGGERKVARLMAPVRPSPPGFRVVSTNGQVVLTGEAGISRGAWNERYPAVFPLDLSALRTPGSYRVEVPTLRVRSADFRIGTAAQLLRWPVTTAATSALARRDDDSRATEHTWPHFDAGGSDVISDPALQRDGDPLDLTGGWGDAGGTVRLTTSTAYTTALLLAAERDLGATAPPVLHTQADVGLAWLRKAWRATPDRVAAQVGIVRGNAARTFLGDRDLWRLPNRDGALPGPQLRYLAERPVFTVDARPGRLSPVLAGRIAAALALSAQVQADRDPKQARQDLALATEVFAHARTEGVDEQDLLVSAPRSLAPDTTWRDDLELGAAELARAAVAVQDPSAGQWVRTASRWAKEYVDEEGDAGQTFGPRDVSALAHAELAAVLDDTPSTGRTERTRELVVADLERQLDLGAAQAGRDPFGAGASPTEPGVVARALGLVASAHLWHRLTGSTEHDAFASAQRQWVLGANPWGVSWVVGVGSASVQCPYHQVANLKGPQNVRGAVVNGPVRADALGSGLDDYPVDSRICPPGGGHQYTPFDGQGAVFVDDVRARQMVEPSISGTATGIFALAQVLRLG